MTIYAIIVTYNASKWIDKCFGSLVNSTMPVKILAIDNASSDGTPDIIRKKFPQVEVIETGQNLGFGKANNIGLKRVLEENADYAFLLNQDAWVEEDTIEKLVEVQHENPEFGILSPLPYDGNGINEDYLFSKYYKQQINRKKEFSHKTYEINFINAAGWLIAKKVILKFGGFHPSFRMHGEDVNYINRIHFKEFQKIGISLGTKYFHDRQKRENDEYSLKKRIYALKSQIKVSMFNPNINSLRLLLSNTITYFISAIKPNNSTQINLYGFYFTILFFFKSISKKNTYIKL